jgi:hypothetical protein
MTLRPYADEHCRAQRQGTPAHRRRFGPPEKMHATIELMTELSFSFENGRFVFEGYRYDRLSDAVSYAHYRRSIAAPR